MSEDTFVHVFPAIRGIQAGREYYVAMCPLRVVPRLFHFDDPTLPAALRAQRVLNEARIPAMATYVVENPRDYVFSSLTASIDGAVRFEPSGEKGPARNLGRLIVPMDARIVINDGQHRRAALVEVFERLPELGDEHISVVLFVDRGLARSQQMFSDLNKNAVRPSKSISILFDHRDPLSGLARTVAQQVGVFRNLIELEKTSISHRSTKLFTLSGLYQASVALLGKSRSDEVADSEANLVIRYWDEVGRNMTDWQQVAAKQVAAVELRQSSVNAHGVVLHALGLLGRQLLAEKPTSWQAQLSKLPEVDWSRMNPAWEGRAMHHGQISKAHKSLLLTTSYPNDGHQVPTPPLRTPPLFPR